MRVPAPGRITLIIPAFLGVAMVLRATHWYALLPERFPVHFDASGVPDAWLATRIRSWMLLPCLGLGLALLLLYLAHLIPAIARRAPAMINLPRKKTFLRLSDDGRASVMTPSVHYLRWTATLLLALFLYMIEGIGKVATGSMAALPMWPVFLFLFAELVALPWLLHASNSALNRISEQEHISE